MSADSDFLRLIGVRKTSDPWVFEGVSLPGRAGNQQPIAYGGCALATALNAAGQTIHTEQRFVPYSVVGHFLGPASLDERYVCEVRPVRDTRTFVTRYVTVKQKFKGEMRSVLALTLDMIASKLSTRQALDHAKSSGKDAGKVKSLLRYQLNATTRLDNVNQLETVDQDLKRRVASGDLQPSHAGAFSEFLGLYYRYFDGRVVPESIMTQNAIALKIAPTTQDHLPLTERRIYDWFRLFQKLPPADGSVQTTEGGPDGQLPQTTVMAHLCGMAFALDGGLAFAPMALSNELLFKAGAASTLDFAQRYHTDVLDVNRWLLREMQSIAGGWQRTFSQATIYDEDSELVASCTQQCVLRPAPGALEEDDNAKAKL
ncbi:hypothetical protein MOBT1_002957 [Malassezia obtusa]|uniref:Acyl-CoA thioesterase II n=1 Tax=Malassezia obtusa TaxID=76774 RepID=A0AAF0E3A2_9BASI|nr:hypothetical protein MOBT1_002957 [Malassezia obtusa]